MVIDLVWVNNWEGFSVLLLKIPYFGLFSNEFYEFSLNTPNLDLVSTILMKYLIKSLLYAHIFQYYTFILKDFKTNYSTFGQILNDLILHLFVYKIGHSKAKFST